MSNAIIAEPIDSVTETESISETQPVVQEDVVNDSDFIKEPAEEDSEAEDIVETQPAIQNGAADDSELAEKPTESVAETESISETPIDDTALTNSKTDTTKKYINKILSVLENRNRVSLAIDMSLMKYGGDSFLRTGNGNYTEKHPGSPALYGLTFQYNFLALGKDLFNNYKWRGNPIFGLGFLLESSFLYGNSDMNYAFGAGLEMQFLWVFRAAIGERIYFKSSRVFGAKGVVDLSDTPPNDFKGIAKEHEWGELQVLSVWSQCSGK